MNFNADACALDSRGAETIIVVTGMDFEARIAAGPGVEVFGRGPGDALVRQLGERLQRPCAGVISFGVAGGLAPTLPPGAVVVAERVAHYAQHRLHCYQTDFVWSCALRAALPTALSGMMAADDSVVATLADKQRLHNTSVALAIDMESHIAARLALAARVPFTACRVVLDPATHTLPSAALAAFGDDGRIDVAALLRVLIREPHQVTGLLRLARQAAIARAALCAARLALGPRFGMPAGLGYR